MKREQILQEAKTWIGTTWQHQAALKGVACDCVGLCRGVYEQVERVTVKVPKNYSATWHLFKDAEKLYTECCNYLQEIPLDEIKPGDVLLFGFGKGPASHMAILSENDTLIHSYAEVGRVVQNSFDDYWYSKLRFAFRFPGVED